METILQEFYDFWFNGEVNKIQPFWFAASKDKRRFRRIHDQFGHHLENVAVFGEKLGIQDDIDDRWNTLAAQAVIFLDQQGRNSRAISGNSCEYYDKVALALARRLAKIPALGDIGAAPFCFITLCLRHSRQLENVQLAQILLENATYPICQPFLRENTAALRRATSLAFVDGALNRDRPAIAGATYGLCEDVLAQRSMGYLDWEQVAAHPLCVELKAALEGIKHPLLSYSGGVDSTCLLVLLKASGIDFRCLFLQHDNRDESEREAQAVKTICTHLEVKLYTYHIRLTRPHDDLERQLGITREEYERWTKEIRFTMYRHLADVVILGHHTDDLDENRLEQISSGHLLGDLDGMTAERKVDGIRVLRPLLHCRKADFRAVLEKFSVPYLKDSTPPWSVRGAMRCLLDDKPQLQPLLSDASKKAQEVATLLDRSLACWETSLSIHEPAKGLPRRAILDLDHLAHSVKEVDFNGLAEIVATIRKLYNPVSSPLKNIPDPMAKPRGLIAFEKAVIIATQSFARPGVIGHYHTSNKPLVNRKAIAHLWSNVMSAKTHFGGGLTQEVGYFCQRPYLVVYDTTTTKKSCQDLKSYFRHILRSDGA